MPNANTPDEMRLAMTVYASQNGRADLVEPMLAELKLAIPLKRLRSWVYRDRKDEYEQIKQEYEAYVRSQAVDGFRAVASLAVEVAGEAMRQTREALTRGEISLKELPKAAASAMVTAGIATDKGELLSGNPTQIVKTDVGDLQRELASVGVTIVLPGQIPEPGKPPIDVQAKQDDDEDDAPAVRVEEAPKPKPKPPALATA